MAESITLETRAVCHKNLYIKPDIYGRLPNSVSEDLMSQKLEANDCNECFETAIDLQKVCDEVNQHFERGTIKMGAQLSANAGQ